MLLYETYTVTILHVCVNLKANPEVEIKTKQA